MARNKTRRIVMTADRYAHPTMGDLAKGAAEFVAPRTVEDGVNLTNVLGDIGELTPFAPAVPFLESRLGLREWDDETIAAMALLGLIPFGGKVAREAGKGIRKTAEAIERIPKGNKGGFIVAGPGPKKRGKYPVDIEGTNKINDWLKSEIEKEPGGTDRYWALDRYITEADKPMSYYDRTVLDPNYTDLLDKQRNKNVLNEIKEKFPAEYDNLVIQEPAYYKPNGESFDYPSNKLSTKATPDNHFMPEFLESDGNLVISPNKFGQQGAIQYTVKDLDNLINKYDQAYSNYRNMAKQIYSNPNLTFEEKSAQLKSIKDALETELQIEHLPD